jgi:hypothetical protein
MHMRKFLIAVLLISLLLGTALALVGCRGAYVGSSMSTKYHDPSCVWAKEIDGERRVWFDSAEEAEAANYSPCGTCLGGVGGASDAPE